MVEIIFRNAEKEDLPEILSIYAGAREFMKKAGNPTQWADRDPAVSVVEEDIRLGRNFVAVKDGRIQAVFAFIKGEDPNYQKIDGEWLNDRPYAAIHRVASRGEIPGMGTEIIRFCFSKEKNIRIDTHKDNQPMQKVIRKNGFTYCGIIWQPDGSERLAFQKEIQ